MPRKSSRSANGTGSIRKIIRGSEGKTYTYWQARYTDPATGLQHSINGRSQKEVREQMIEALNHGKDNTPEQVLQGVRRAVDDFVKDAEQFDDLTMMCLEYKGRPEENRSIMSEEGI